MKGDRESAKFTSSLSEWMKAMRHIRCIKLADIRDDMTWKLKLCLIPRQCYLTGDTLWFEQAYHGVNNYPTPFVEEDVWIKKDMYIIEKLKGSF